MLKRELFLPPEHLFPADEWRIAERRYSEEYFARAETIFALGNGYLGVRGTFDEGRPTYTHGTFVNGFHETWPILHPETAYGLARTGQTMVNVPDATNLRLYVGDEPFYLPTARLTEYERVLDMREGTVERRLVWSTPGGKHVRLTSCRLVSLEERHLLAIRYTVTLLDHPAPVTVTSHLVNRQDAAAGRANDVEDPRLARVLGHQVLRGDVSRADGGRMLLGFTTTNSGMTLGVGVGHVVECDLEVRCETSLGSDAGHVVYSVDAEPGVPLVVTKLATYHSSRSAPPEELVQRCGWTLDRGCREGFDALRRTQRANLDRFWDRADVQVEADEQPVRTQQAVRWNLFQVCQATWHAEGTGVPAKGLTGQAYDGHYFWDSETYVLPFLCYTQPRLARSMLRFRRSMLPRARERARELSQRGALFPWRTINGEEASANFQAGTAQYHINADIAYAVVRYMRVRGDENFAVEAGAELLVETARLWEDLGFYGDDGRFHIYGVTGPDEYTTVVNDNAFTNLMARENLREAAACLERLQEHRPDDHAALVADLRLAPDEVDAWRRAAEAMFVPYDEARGIHPQDDAFLRRKVWDLASTARDKFPLLLHYHPLVIYRHQVIKQADIVMAMFLLGNEFSQEQKRRDFEYYDRLTTGDSSLSACVQSIVAAELGLEEQAMDYFRYALLMDLADVAGNVSDGVHVASAAGVWSSLVFGFGGVRDYGGRLSFDPRLPHSWRSLAFPLRFQDRQVRVRLAHDVETYLVEDGEPLEVTVRGQDHVLRPGEPLERPVRPAADAG